MLGLIILTGCLNRQNNTGMDSQFLHTQTPHIIPTGLEVPTISPEQNNNQNKITGTLQPEDAFGQSYTENCLQISPNSEVMRNESGLIYLEPTSMKENGYENKISALVLETGKFTSISLSEDVFPREYRISPDGKFIAFWKIRYAEDGTETNRGIVIVDKTGKELIDISGQADWGSFYWLNNDRLVIGMSGLPYVFNPFTGEKYTISEWYSESPGGISTVTIWSANGIFDGLLKQIFYIQQDGSLHLWDMENKREFVNISTKIPHAEPKWSNDNKYIAFSYTAKDELYISTRDGKITKLTKLQNHFEKVSISSIAWSPDSKFIAIQFRDFSNTSNLPKLAIVDIATLNTINYCDIMGSLNETIDPIWSPDGTNLVLGRKDNNSESYSSVIIDIKNENAVKIVDNMLPVGWTAYP